MKKLSYSSFPDSLRMSISKVRLEKIDFDPVILPKTIFQLCSLLDNYDGNLSMQR